MTFIFANLNFELWSLGIISFTVYCSTLQIIFPWQFTVILNLNTVSKHKICKAEILNADISFFKFVSFNICFKSHIQSLMYWSKSHISTISWVACELLCLNIFSMLEKCHVSKCASHVLRRVLVLVCGKDEASNMIVFLL